MSKPKTDVEIWRDTAQMWKGQARKLAAENAELKAALLSKENITVAAVYGYEAGVAEAKARIEELEAEMKFTRANYDRFGTSPPEAEITEAEMESVYKGVSEE